MNGRNDRVRAHAKHGLLSRPWPIPSDRAIPGYWERIESLTCRSKPDMARPTQLTSTGRGCSHQPGHPSQDFHISSAGASRTRVPGVQRATNWATGRTNTMQTPGTVSNPRIWAGQRIGSSVPATNNALDPKMHWFRTRRTSQMNWFRTLGTCTLVKRNCYPSPWALNWDSKFVFWAIRNTIQKISMFNICGRYSTWWLSVPSTREFPLK